MATSGYSYGERWGVQDRYSSAASSPQRLATDVQAVAARAQSLAQRPQRRTSDLYPTPQGLELAVPDKPPEPPPPESAPSEPGDSLPPSEGRAADQLPDMRCASGTSGGMPPPQAKLSPRTDRRRSPPRDWPPPSMRMPPDAAPGDRDPGDGHHPGAAPLADPSRAADGHQGSGTPERRRMSPLRYGSTIAGGTEARREETLTPDPASPPRSHAASPQSGAPLTDGAAGQMVPEQLQQSAKLSATQRELSARSEQLAASEIGRRRTGSELLTARSEASQERRRADALSRECAEAAARAAAAEADAVTLRDELSRAQLLLSGERARAAELEQLRRAAAEDAAAASAAAGQASRQLEGAAAAQQQSERRLQVAREEADRLLQELRQSRREREAALTEREAAQREHRRAAEECRAREEAGQQMRAELAQAREDSARFRQRIEQRDDQIRQLRDEAARLRLQLGQTEGDRSAEADRSARQLSQLRDELAAARKGADDAERRAHETGLRLAAAEGDVTALTAEVERLGAELRAQGVQLEEAEEAAKRAGRGERDARAEIARLEQAAEEEGRDAAAREEAAARRERESDAALAAAAAEARRREDEIERKQRDVEAARQELAAAEERAQGLREQLRRSEAKGADAEAALSAALAAVSAAVTAAAAAFGSIPAWRRDWGLMRELCRRAALLPRKDDPPADSTETLDGLQRMLRKDWLLFASHAAVRDTRLQRADRHKELAGLLRRSSVFVAHYPVRGAKQQTRSPQVQTWSPQVWVETEKGVRPFPYMMRPACTLLNLLGRSKPELGKQKGTEIEGEYMEWAHSSARHSAINPHMVLSCEFNEPLHSLGPQHGQRHRVTLNAAAIDNYVRECEEAGERDQVWDAITNCAAPPKAVDIYGTENFSVSIAEVQQLVNSTQVCTSGKLPLLFYLDIVRRFGTDRLFSCGPAKEEDEAVSRFFSPTRATPLNWLAAAEEDEEDPGKVNCLKIIEELRTKAAKKVEECRDNLKKQKRDGKDAGRYWSQQRNLLCYNFQSDVLGDTEFINRARSQLAEWRAMVLDKPAWWGFDSSATAEHMFTLSLTSLATTVCLSQKGYFLAAGDAEVHNQLCERTESQVVFICSSGIDFNSQMTRDMEKVKYFVTRTQAKGEDSPLSSQTVGQETVTRLEGFRPGGQESLLHRITELYDCIFRSARAQNVRNMSMLPLGLGEFLKKMKDDSWNLYAEVVRTYYRAQFLLLQREDWHFDNYFLSCPSDQRCFAAQTLTECVLHSRSEGGPVFSTNIVLHDRDSKSVALNLARRGMAPAFLVPCDPQALIHGTLGMDWEVGRGNCYGGEQDWGATSTGALGCFNVSGGAIGLDDVVLLEQDRTYLHVSRLWRGSASARTTATGMQNNTLEADPLSRSEAGPHGGERDPDIRSDRHSTVEAPTEVQLVCTRTVRADRAGLNVRPVAQATFGPFTGFEWSDSDRREIAFVKPRSRPRAREAKPGAGEAPQERRAQVAGQRAALDDPPEPERKVFRLADLSRPLYESLKRRLSELCHEHPQAMGQQHPQGEYDCRTSMQRHTSIPSPRAGARRISSAFSVESVIRSAMRPVQLAASHNDVYSPEIG